MSRASQTLAEYWDTYKPDKDPPGRPGRSRSHRPRCQSPVSGKWLVTAERHSPHSLDYLQEVSERPNITLRVIPFEAEGYIGSGHAMVYACGQVPQLDTVQIEAEHAVTLLDAAAHLAKYRTIFDAVKAVTLGETESRGFIQSVAQQL
jgi:hypothetical protein